MSQVTGWAVGGLAVAAVAGSVWWKASAPALDPPKPTQFAEDAVPNAITPADIKFDAERALKYLKQLCDLGPRISGSEGMKKQQEIIEKHFKGLGATVARQEFKARQVSKRADTPMANLVISWHPDKARRVLISAHYDTRPIADQEPQRANWTKPFVSANDGTAGVALMMELGHHMKGLKAEVGVDFVLFDGEEYVFETNPLGGGDKYFFGSEHFAEDYTRTKDTRTFKYEGGVLLDLCTAKGAVLRPEAHSIQGARGVVDSVWGVARAVGAKSFRYENGGPEVLDDHIALILAGIPTADIIDFDYPHWHKLTDTPDKVSGEQVAEVARVLATWLTVIK
jgi:hypothetical protein